MTRTQPSSSVLTAFRGLGIPTEDLVQVSSDKVIDQKGDLEYFVKVTRSRETTIRFKGEAESLRALGTAAPGFVPKLFGISNLNGEAVMISEHFDLSYMSSKFERPLARRLAGMHDPTRSTSRSPNGMYGFDVSTHCGDTEQDNQWENDWMVFFRDRRIKSVIDRLDDVEIKRLGKNLCESVIPFLLTNFQPSPTPVIIHGDLWSGNISVNKKTGQPVLFDPSSYYGHHEVELGIMNMFGGRSSAFFEEYHHHIPRSTPHHEQRISLYELYHHLNHTLIFGGSYRHGAIRIINQLIDYVMSQKKTMNCFIPQEKEIGS